MDGAASDLRPGPALADGRDPRADAASCSSSRRRPRSSSAILDREEAASSRLVRNGWVQLATLDPDGADHPPLPGRPVRAATSPARASCRRPRPRRPGIGAGATTWASAVVVPGRRRRRRPTAAEARAMTGRRCSPSSVVVRHRGARAAAGRARARRPAGPAAERGAMARWTAGCVVCGLVAASWLVLASMLLDRLPVRPARARRLGRHPRGRLPLPPEVRLRPALGAVRGPDVRAGRHGRRLRQPLPAPRAGLRPLLPATSPCSCWAWSSPRWPGRSRRCSWAGSWSGCPRRCWWPSSTSGRRRSINGQRIWSVYRIADAAFLLAAVVLHHVSGAGDFAELMGTGPVAGGRGGV